MGQIDFLNKTITINTSTTSIPITPITNRISSTLFAEFSNLNFAGVYKIGSETDKRKCYIGASYNLTDKITHHLNLLYRKEHHSKELQDWVNENGIEAIDISILRQCKSIPTELSNWEQYYLTLIKPMFNTVLNKKEIQFEVKEYTPLRYANIKELNIFGNSIVNPRKRDTKYKEIVFINKISEIDEERKYWKPTVIINLDETIVTRGDITNFKEKKKVDVIETVVYRKGVFGSR